MILPLLLSGLLAALLCASAEDLKLLYTFGNGQRFYVDADSFRTLDENTLTFNVVGFTQDLLINGKKPPRQPVTGYTVTQNRLDCDTGIYEPEPQWQRFDDQGQVIEAHTAASRPMKLAPGNVIYRLGRKACLRLTPLTAETLGW
ncbi:MAG: hypothetical protein AB7P76_06910 [Candidatus Melainabacteria bacterium]